MNISPVERAVVESVALGRPLRRLTHKDAADLCNSTFLEFTLRKRTEVIELDTIKFRVRGRPYRAAFVSDFMDALSTPKYTQQICGLFDLEVARGRHLLLFLLDLGLVRRTLDDSNLETWVSA